MKFKVNFFCFLLFVSVKDISFFAEFFKIFIPFEGARKAGQGRRVSKQKMTLELSVLCTYETIN